MGKLMWEGTGMRRRNRAAGKEGLLSGCNRGQAG